MIQLHLGQDLIHPQNISLAHEGLITVLGILRWRGSCKEGKREDMMPRNLLTLQRICRQMGWGLRGGKAQSSWTGSVHRWPQLILQVLPTHWV